MNQQTTPADQLECDLRQMLAPKQFDFSRQEIELLCTVLVGYAKRVYATIGYGNSRYTPVQNYEYRLQQRSDIEIAHALVSRLSAKLTNLRLKSQEKYKTSLIASQICVLQSALSTHIDLTDSTSARLIYGKIHQKTV